MVYPPGFLWGAAGAAYQVEGAWDEDGKAPSIWDALCEGRIAHGDDGRTACDHYHRFPEDVALMKAIGLKSLRFSVSWPRVIPSPGKVNEKGLDFYVRLVKALAENGIEPLCTLYHWDMPLWVYEKGGWENEETAELFAAYTETVVKALSPWVRYWFTFNEPQIFIGMGYHTGEHPPFLTEPATLPRVSRNVMLAHGKAVEIIRARAVRPPLIGFAPTGSVCLPLDGSEEEIERARAQSYPDDCGPRDNNWWADPIVLGRIPRPLRGTVTEKDLETICRPLDFYAFNVYFANDLMGADGKPLTRHAPGRPRTAMGWPVTPEVMYWAARFHYERYRLPLMITENGMAAYDFRSEDGRVHDPQRAAFIRTYLKQLEKAMAEGVPVIGYQYWSLLDNFEWTCGYDMRFGLIYVDFVTKERVPKDSAREYARIIRENGT